MVFLVIFGGDCGLCSWSLRMPYQDCVTITFLTLSTFFKVTANLLWQMAAFMKDSLLMVKSRDTDFAAGLQQRMNTRANLSKVN